MIKGFSCAIAVLSACVTAVPLNDETGPQEKFFEVPIDHYANGGNLEYFKMRYIIDATYYDPETGPILYYAGNEGNIWDFYDNSGFMTQTLAKEHKALVVAGEHRYFGVSYPYDPSVAFTPEHNRYLTVEQTLMDYVTLIKYVRDEYDAHDKACIVFGGSYGGMLAAWLRIKFPTTFQGALAASAPFLYFRGAPSAPEDGFGEIVTNDFREALDKSPLLIRESWETMMDLKTRTDTWDELSEIFATCSPIDSEEQIDNLYAHLSNGYMYMAMTDYPYPANFLEPMPGYPVNESVKPFEPINLAGEQTFFEKIQNKFENKFTKINGGMTTRESNLLNALSDSTNVYFNYTGQYPCTNLSDTEGVGNLDSYGWNILACNELFQPTALNDESMFIPAPIDYDSYTAYCQEKYGLTPQYDWALDYFGGHDINKDFLALTNIIFSNGNLDPWMAGGLNYNVTADGSGIALLIEGGAHHLDLRLPSDLDPEFLTEARAIESAHIKKWIDEYQN